MNRSRLCYLPVMVLLSLVWACGGAPRQVTQAPVMARDGARQIQKGNLQYTKGCYQRAAAHFSRAHAEFTAADDLPGIAVSLNSLGNVYQATGDVDNAVAFFDEALAISRARDDRQAALQAMANKAAAFIGADRLDDAQAVLTTAAALEPGAFLPLQINQGILFFKQAAYPQAQAALESALTDVAKEDQSSRAKIQFALGRVKQAQGDAAGAGDHFQLALTADRAAGFYAGMAQDHIQLGAIRQEQGSAAKAVAHYKQAVKIYALLGDAPKVNAAILKLEQAAETAEADIRLTIHFAKTWLEDKGLQRPCR